MPPFAASPFAASPFAGSPFAGSSRGHHLASIALFCLALPLAAQDLAADFARLEAHSPGRQAPPDALLRAASERLHAALPQLLVGDDAAARRLRTLLEQHGDNLVPSQAMPTKADDPLRRLLVRAYDERLQQQPAAAVRALAAAAASFPGAVPADATAVDLTATIDLAVPGRHSLGLYAAAGAPITVTTGTSPPPGCAVRIGIHCDDLQPLERWSRLPRITRAFPLAGAANTTIVAACAFGGLVCVEVPPGHDGRLQVTVRGAVRAPRFLLGTTTPAAWREHERQAPGPWAELATAKVVLAVPSTAVRGLDDPTALLQFWDSVLEGASTLAARPPGRERPEYFVADLVSRHRHGASADAITLPLAEVADLVDLARLQQAPWGVFHELGHVHQRPDWTFAGAEEVTVNLFSLYLSETLGGRGPDRVWGGNLVRARATLARLLREGGEPWRGPGGEPDLALRLLMYQQLRQSFGWQPFVDVFAEYAALPDDQRPTTDAQKRDQWLVRLSHRVGRDLGPFFQAWGLPTSDAARDHIAGLPDWFPASWPGIAPAPDVLPAGAPQGR